MCGDGGKAEGCDHAVRDKTEAAMLLAQGLAMIVGHGNPPVSQRVAEFCDLAGYPGDRDGRPLMAGLAKIGENSLPGLPASNVLLGENELAIARDAQAILGLLQHEDEFALAAQQFLYVQTPKRGFGAIRGVLPGNIRGRRHDAIGPIHHIDPLSHATPGSSCATARL
jgi:hypothetical protein